VLWKIFELRKNEVHEHFWILLNQKLDLCRSPSIVRIVKSGRLIWVDHVTRMGDGYRILLGK